MSPCPSPPTPPPQDTPQTRPKAHCAKISWRGGAVPTAASASSPTGRRTWGLTWSTIDPTRPRDATPSRRRATAALAIAATSSTSRRRPWILGRNGWRYSRTTARPWMREHRPKAPDWWRCLTRSSELPLSVIFILTWCASFSGVKGLPNGRDICDFRKEGKDCLLWTNKLENIITFNDGIDRLASD